MDEWMAPIKFGIQLPDWYERRLRLWAAWKGTTRATLAANILQARIEANWEQVDRDLDDLAKQQGKTRAELETEMLGTDDD